jgi:hypothetical protein
MITILEVLVRLVDVAVVVLAPVWIYRTIKGQDPGRRGAASSTRRGR